MSASTIIPANPTHNPTTSSELEDLILQIHIHAHSTAAFLLSLYQNHLDDKAPLTHQTFQQLQNQHRNLKTHYGWALASDHEQVARLEGSLTARGCLCKRLDGTEKFRKQDGEVGTVKEVFEVFDRLGRDLDRARVRFEDALGGGEVG